MNTWIDQSLKKTIGLLGPVADTRLIADLRKIAELAEMYLERDFFNAETDDFIDRLAVSASNEDLSEIALEICGSFGMQHLSVAGVREAAGSIFRNRIFTTLPGAWVSEYVENGYQLWDPLFADPQASDHAFLDEACGKTPMTSEFLRKLRLAGIGPSGFMSWVEVGPGAIVGLLLTSVEKPELFAERMERIRTDLLAISNALALAFTRANVIADFDPMGLSDDELIMVRALASGVSEQPAAECIVRSAGDRAQVLCRRIGAQTLTQAVLAVASSGILSFSPLRTADFCLANATVPSPLQHQNFGPTAALSRPTAAPTTNPCPKTNARCDVAETASLYEVRRWGKGWAVFRNGKRFSDVFHRREEAERACTQSAWGGAAVGFHAQTELARA